MTSIKKTGFLAVFLPLVAVCSGFYGCMTAGDGTVTIAGQVFDGLDADGNPLPAATVKVFEADGTTQDGPTVQTDGQGNFNVTVIPATFPDTTLIVEASSDSPFLPLRHNVVIKGGRVISDEAIDTTLKFYLSSTYADGGGSSDPLGDPSSGGGTVAGSDSGGDPTSPVTTSSSGAGSGGGASSSPVSGSTPPPAASVSFASDIQPIFTARCASCHGGSSPAGGMGLAPGIAYNAIVNVPSQEKPSLMRVKPGDSANSWLYIKVSQSAPGVGGQMPADGNFLTPAMLQLLQNWIQEGAPNN